MLYIFTEGIVLLVNAHGQKHLKLLQTCLHSLPNQTERETETEADKVTIQIPGGDSPTPFRLLWASFLSSYGVHVPFTHAEIQFPCVHVNALSDRGKRGVHRFETHHLTRLRCWSIHKLLLPLEIGAIYHNCLERKNSKGGPGFKGGGDTIYPPQLGRAP